MGEVTFGTDRGEKPPKPTWGCSTSRSSCRWRRGPETPVGREEEPAGVSRDGPLPLRGEANGRPEASHGPWFPWVFVGAWVP